MLAQNFMTPAELGIEDAMFNALVKVLGMLEREEIPRASKVVPTLKQLHPPTHFNMSFVEADIGCGTACCILGWADHVAGQRLSRKRTIELSTLFMVSTGVHGHALILRNKTHDDVTPAEAAIALRSYLTTGDAKWHEALGA